MKCENVEQRWFTSTNAIKHAEALILSIEKTTSIPPGQGGGDIVATPICCISDKKDIVLEEDLHQVETVEPSGPSALHCLDQRLIGESPAHPSAWKC